MTILIRFDIDVAGTSKYAREGGERLGVVVNFGRWERIKITFTYSFQDRAGAKLVDE